MVALFLSFALAIGTFAAQTAQATTILVVTDQPKALKAREVAALFRKTEPFSRMKDLKLKVIQTSVRKLGCQSAPMTDYDLVASSEDAEGDLLARAEWRERSISLTGSLPPSCSNKDGPISRLISCDTPQANAYLAALQRTEKAQIAIVVKTDTRYGGSGGKRPVITTGSPAVMAIHELMHQLGFADEYAYISACEADIYCPAGAEDSKSPSGYGALPGTSFNVAAFNARSSYASNAEARKAHAQEIPWINSISGTTDLVRNGKLGSAPVSGVTGVYRSIVCDKASSRRDTWQPVPDDTIMKTLATTKIPRSYWATIAKSLGTRITP